MLEVDCVYFEVGNESLDVIEAIFKLLSLFLFRRLAVGLSAQRPGSDLGPVHVRFVL